MRLFIADDSLMPIGSHQILKPVKYIDFKRAEMWYYSITKGLTLTYPCALGHDFQEAGGWAVEWTAGCEGAEK